MEEENQNKLLSQDSLEKYIETNEKEKPRTWFTILIGPIFLFLMVTCASAIPPIVNEIKTDNLMLRICWRSQINTYYYFLICMIEIHFKGKWYEIKSFFKLENFKHVIYSSFALMACYAFFIPGTALTITSHAVLFESLGGANIVLWKLISRQNLHSLEKIGTFIAVFGTVVTIMDSDASKTKWENFSFIGDLSAIISSIFFGIYMVVSKGAVDKYPTYFVLTCNAFIVSILSSFLYLFISLFSDSQFFASQGDFLESIFGWYSGESFLYFLFVVGPIGGPLGNGLVITCLNFFSPHVVGNVLLLQPVSGQFLGCLMDQDHIPGILTFLGAVVISGGLVLVIRGSKTREKGNTTRKKSEDEIELNQSVSIL